MDDRTLRKLRRVVSASSDPVGEDELAALRDQVGPLPREYRDFLTSYGGAAARAEAEVTDATGRSDDLVGFYGLRGDERLRLDPGHPAVEDGVLPIAETAAGVLLYLDLPTGTVWRTDDAGERRLPDGVTVTLAADSFTDLLDQITVGPEDPAG